MLNIRKYFEEKPIFDEKADSWKRRTIIGREKTIIGREINNMLRKPII